jgi:hypothetical protein
LNQNSTTKLLGSVLMIGAAYLCADEHSVNLALTTSSSNVIRSGNNPHVLPSGSQDQPIILPSAMVPQSEDRPVDAIGQRPTHRPLVVPQRQANEVLLSVPVIPGT